jgi:hypothetical protein
MNDGSQMMDLEVQDYDWMFKLLQAADQEVSVLEIIYFWYE